MYSSDVLDDRVHECLAHRFWSDEADAAHIPSVQALDDFWPAVEEELRAHSEVAIPDASFRAVKDRILRVMLADLAQTVREAFEDCLDPDVFMHLTSEQKTRGIFGPLYIRHKLLKNDPAQFQRLKRLFPEELGEFSWLSDAACEHLIFARLSPKPLPSVVRGKGGVKVRRPLSFFTDDELRFLERRYERLVFDFIRKQAKHLRLDLESGVRLILYWAFETYVPGAGKDIQGVIRWFFFNLLNLDECTRSLIGPRPARLVALDGSIHYLRGRLGRRPSDAELAEFWGIGEEYIVARYVGWAPVHGWHAPVNGVHTPRPRRYSDVIGEPDEAMHLVEYGLGRNFWGDTEARLDRLAEIVIHFDNAASWLRAIEMFRLRFPQEGEGLTHEAIAKQLGLSRETVRKWVVCVLYHFQTGECRIYAEIPPSERPQA